MNSVSAVLALSCRLCLVVPPLFATKVNIRCPPLLFEDKDIPLTDIPITMDCAANEWLVAPFVDVDIRDISLALAVKVTIQHLGLSSCRWQLTISHQELYDTSSSLLTSRAQFA